MGKKISWKMIHTDFKKRYPSLAKEMIYYRPKDFLTIEVWLKDGTIMTYDYFKHKVKVLNETWKK